MYIEKIKNDLDDFMTDFGENVAAISAAIHANSQDLEKILSQLPSDAGGYVGLWEYCVTAAKIFTDEAGIYVAGEDYYWVAAIEDYAGRITGNLVVGELPNAESLHLLAGASIECNRT